MGDLGEVSAAVHRKVGRVRGHRAAGRAGRPDGVARHRRVVARRPAPLPAVLTEGVFTVESALRAGVGESRLRRRDLSAPFRGVRVVGPAEDLVLRCRAALQLLPPGAVLSHVTAARLLGVELPWQLDSDDRIHVRLSPGTTPPRRPGMTGHRSADPGQVLECHGLPVMSPEDTWRDLAAVATVDDVVVLGDAMMRRRQPFTTRGALEGVLRRTRPGRRGRARMRLALLDVRAGTDSTMETRTRLLLVRSGLPCPAVNEPVHDGTGHFLAMPDMLYRSERVAIEYDGDVHRTDQATWRRDIDRRERLQAAGWLVMTATADDVVRRPEAFVARVRATLRRRAR